MIDSILIIERNFVILHIKFDGYIFNLQIIVTICESNFRYTLIPDFDLRKPKNEKCFSLLCTRRGEREHGCS